MSESIENILARRLEKSRALCQKIYPPSAAHDENFKVDYGQRDIRSKYNHYLLYIIYKANTSIICKLFYKQKTPLIP